MRKSNWRVLFALPTILLVSAAAADLSASRSRPKPPPPKPAPPPPPAAKCGSQSYKVGIAKSDVTGAAAETGMMGYAEISQVTEGIHMRLWSRAYAIQQCKGGKVLIFASVDIGQMFQSVHQGVLKKLKNKYGNAYNFQNVILSATHTHSGPGGYSHRALYNLSTKGYIAQNYNAIVNGTFESIDRAITNMKNDRTGHSLYYARRELTNASFNRSSKAYMQNGDKPFGTGKNQKNDPSSRTLTFVRDSDKKVVGLINWFAVHPTNIGNTNRIITGDSKGYASWKMETRNPGMVAAFAQASVGDMSPNFWGVPGKSDTDFNRMKIIADRQFNAANSAKGDRRTRITGPIKAAARYVYMPNVTVPAAYTGTGRNQRLCKPAIGISMLAGSTEDGPGLGFIPEGLNWDKLFRWLDKNTAWIPAGFREPLRKAIHNKYRDNCHAEKLVALPTAATNAPAWTELHMPIQVAKLGDLTIIPLPFECTVVCGKRLGDSIARAMGSPTDLYVIAGMSNGYSGYVTTREEYTVQHYEGASVHYGPFTHNAYMYLYKRIADHLARGSHLNDMSVHVQPEDLSNRQITLQTGVVFDDSPADCKWSWSWPPGPRCVFDTYGRVRKDPNGSYRKGNTVEVKFQAGHPKNNLKRNSTFLMVQRKVNGSWRDYIGDNHPDTRYYWKRDGVANSIVTVKWRIDGGVPGGKYRVVHYGNYKNGWNGQIKSYSGSTREFRVY